MTFWSERSAIGALFGLVYLFIGGLFIVAGLNNADPVLFGLGLLIARLA